MHSDILDLLFIVFFVIAFVMNTVMLNALLSWEPSIEACPIRVEE